MTENFLQRWSRLKRDPPASKTEAPAAPRPSAGLSPGAPAAQPLPALDSLEFSSDFTAFMAGEVEDGLRRAALQKLFHAEHFNVMDGLDVYVDDYNTFEPIGEELLRNLNQGRGLIFDDEQPTLETTAAPPVEAAPSPAETVVPDEPPASPDSVMDKSS